MNEREWVNLILPRFQELCQEYSGHGITVQATTGQKIPYLFEILKIDGEGQIRSKPSVYETDLLLYDLYPDQSWVPRIVIECKRGNLTTHSALTYSAKAATHKQVQPHLRYGMLVGSWGGYSLPPRLIRHGAHFDFMATWCLDQPDGCEWGLMKAVIAEELVASRFLQRLQTDGKFKSNELIKLVHRKLIIR